MKKMVIVSGYFNPLHKGHLELFHRAKTYGTGDKLLVIVNSDHQRKLKGSKEFQDEMERLMIIRNLRVVDESMISIDKDKTQCATLKYLSDIYSNEYQLFFANGGDQNNESIPEAQVCLDNEIKLIDGLGDKIQSSSWLLNK
jgi:D-beta-D-heptose 7-phosphate kinase/D-beta-D-heptose 1-phosphate adenosyltransferase